MPTGGGKSLCYQLPALMMEGTAIVISPLIALMKNQVDAMRNYSDEDGVAHFLNSSLNKQEIEEVKRDVLSGQTKMLYVAPESLTKSSNVEFLRNIDISFYAVDEAHCISEWGHDFRPEYRRIRPIINEIHPRPIIALTATATPKVQHDIQKNLAMTDAVVFKSSFNRPNLNYEVRHKTSDIDREIIKFIISQGRKSGIVYCLSRKKVDDFAEILQANDIRALPYHAGMDAVTRSNNQDAFLMEEVDVIVATIAFGMGIDKPDVRYVIHYDIPKSLEGYYQETGAPAGMVARASVSPLLEERPSEAGTVHAGKTGFRTRDRQTAAVRDRAYAETSVCRRKVLLHYFGEEYTVQNCEHCDNCLNPKIKVEAKELLITALEAITVLKEKHKTDYVIDFLTGRDSSDIETYGDDKLEEFGSGSDEEESIWEAVIRQALLDNYLLKEIENYGILKITKKGKNFLKNPVSFKITKPDEDEDDMLDLTGDDSDAMASAAGSGGAADPQLYAMMKDLRKKLSKKLNVPPYVIFQPASLEAMATSYPITEEELQNIPGVGAGKAKRYGKEFLELIKRHVEENEITRPEDLRVKTVANKSKLKVAIVQAIDRKVALDDLAESRGIDFDELLTEVEAIVYSGTKINIDYFLDEVLDIDVLEDVYDYFREAPTDNLDTAQDELPEYTETEIRLVRIKFISDMAN